MAFLFLLDFFSSGMHRFYLVVVDLRSTQLLPIVVRYCFASLFTEKLTNNHNIIITHQTILLVTIR